MYALVATLVYYRFCRGVSITMKYGITLFKSEIYEFQSMNVQNSLLSRLLTSYSLPGLNGESTSVMQLIVNTLVSLLAVDVDGTIRYEVDADDDHQTNDLPSMYLVWESGHPSVRSGFR